jgi:hypothetical protein
MLRSRPQIRLGWSFEADRPYGYYSGADLRLVRVETDGYWLGRGGVLCVGWWMLWFLRPLFFVPVVD